MIAPAFGGTIYVWASLLSVTLMALGMGYFFGGRLADQFDPAALLEQVLGFSIIVLFALPYYSPPITESAANLGVRLGSLTATGILIGPPLFAMGCVTPICLRMRIRSLENVGREFGSLSFWSTLGSILGALITGFFLVEFLPIQNILQLLACALAFFLATLFLFSDRGRRSSRTSASLTLALALGGLLAVSTGAATVALDSQSTLSVRSLYGEVRIEDNARRGTRTLFLDGLPNGRVSLADKRSVSDIVHAFELTAFLRPASKRGLMLGLGAGCVVRNLWEHHGIPVDVVELDPVVATTAHRYFDFAPSGEIHIGDGRRYCHTTDLQYGIIIVDAFAGGNHPFHLLSLEAIQDYESVLERDGVIAFNLLGYFEGRRAGLRASFERTLREVFSHVNVIPANTILDISGVSNLLFLASHESLEFRKDPMEADDSLVRYYHRIKHRFTQVESFGSTETPQGTVLIDDYNPADLIGSEAFLNIRRQSSLFRASVDQEHL